MGFLASLPLWAGVVGDTVGGLATDWLLLKTGNAKLAPRAVAITGMLGCVAFIVPAALTSNALTAVYCLTASMFFLECTIGPSWAVPMHVGGKYSGTVQACSCSARPCGPSGSTPKCRCWTGRHGRHKRPPRPTERPAPPPGLAEKPVYWAHCIFPG